MTSEKKALGLGNERVLVEVVLNAVAAELVEQASDLTVLINALL